MSKVEELIRQKAAKANDLKKQEGYRFTCTVDEATYLRLKEIAKAMNMGVMELTSDIFAIASKEAIATYDAATKKPQ